MFRPYVTVLRIRGVGLPVVASFIGAVPIGMVSLGILLTVHAATGSFAAAGAVAGAHGIGNALGLIIQGRLINRWGQTRILIGTAVLCPTTLITFTVAAGHRSPLAVLAGLAAAAGAAIPATTSCMRVLWPTLVTAPHLRTTAYAVLATQFQIAMITGPLLVSGLVLISRPADTLLAAATVACAAGLLFALTPAARRWQPAAPQPKPRTDRPSTGLQTLIVGSAGAGAAAGILAVGVPAAAAGHHPAALAGLMFAAFAAGELVGGICYGGTPWRWPAANRLVAAQLGAAISTGALAHLTGLPIWMLIVMFTAGVFTAPMSITNSALLDDVAPAGTLARSYTVMVSAGLLGSATGNTAGGLLDHTTSHTTMLTAAATTMTSVALWTGLRRRTLTAPNSPAP